MEASFLLQTSQLSITQIADYLHFADTPSFSKFFSRLSGMSPKEYRKGWKLRHNIGRLFMWTWICSMPLWSSETIRNCIDHGTVLWSIYSITSTRTATFTYLHPICPIARVGQNVNISRFFICHIFLYYLVIILVYFLVFLQSKVSLLLRSGSPSNHLRTHDEPTTLLLRAQGVLKEY